MPRISVFYFCVILTVRVFNDVSQGATILGVFPIPSVSHHVVYHSLMKALAERGHEVVALTPFPDKDTKIENYTEIDLSFIQKIWLKRHDLYAVKRKVWPETSVTNFMEMGYLICEALLTHPEIKKFINSSKIRTFDVVFVEWLVNPCVYGFAYKFSSPMIGISSLGILLPGHDAVGNPTHPAYLPDISLPYTNHMTYWERMHSLVNAAYYRYLWHFHVIPRQDALTRKVFGNEMPYLGDLDRNVSMMFTNSRFVLHYPRPNVPALIEMGGLHVRDTSPLPMDLQEFLDGAHHGAVYMSLGSNLMSSLLPEAKFKAIVSAFRSLSPVRILWKWEAPTMHQQPKNVKFRHWLPQRAVLAHPNVRVFISHGGQQSVEESVHSGVPIIGIPFFADQTLNVKKLASAGAAIYVDYDALTKETLEAAINVIINDSSYAEEMRKLSALVNDLPETSLNRTIWWTEYVIRHRGARHLRSAALDLQWYQLLLLDVVLGLVVAVALVLCLLHLSLRAIFRFAKMHSRVKKKTE